MYHVCVYRHVYVWTCVDTDMCMYLRVCVHIYMTILTSLILIKFAIQYNTHVRFDVYISIPFTHIMAGQISLVGRSV